MSQATMHQLTIRGYDDELQHELEAVARHRGISLNKAALLLIRRGAGIDDDGLGGNAIGNALDAFIGSWTAEEEAEFLASLAMMNQIDPGLWE